jgi:hypothetical protein
MPPRPATGLGFSSPDTNIQRSPDSALSVSSTSSDTKGMSFPCNSGVATEGLHMVAAQDASIREDSAPSRGGRSMTSVLSIEDSQSRDRSLRRIDPIEDGTPRASTFGPQRSRERRGDHLSQYLTDVIVIQETAHTAECWLMPTPETWTVLTLLSPPLPINWTWMRWQMIIISDLGPRQAPTTCPCQADQPNLTVQDLPMLRRLNTIMIFR